MGKGKERWQPKQETKSDTEHSVSKPTPVTVVLSHDNARWMNGQKVEIALEPIVGAKTTVLKGSATQTYRGAGGVPADDPAALAAFDRVVQTLSNNPALRTDDCLTGQGNTPDILVSLIGRNAKGSAKFIYIARRRVDEGRHEALYLGASLGAKRNQFESGLTRATYSSTRG